jgi:hypothetical protein
MIRGKCNCGKKATSEWVTVTQPKRNKKFGLINTLVFCELCKPKQESINFYRIYGK